MIPNTLASRLVLVFAALSFLIMGTAGAVLYDALETQLALRDDAALVTRVEQIRTWLHDVDLVYLIQQKPQLFSNMLGNREALLVVGFPGEAPLIQVNPGGTELPDVMPVSADSALPLSAVFHTTRHHIPFIAVGAKARITHEARELHIVAGRLMTERSRLLSTYRERIFLVAAGAALLLALLSWLVVRRGLVPLRLLAEQTEVIGIRNLSIRIDATKAPGELLPLIRGFNAMLDRLETSFTQLSQVSSDMAHDLRTPISNMLGQTEVALGHRRDAAYYEKLLGSNFEELQRLSRMTDNMLFLARAEHADNSIERKEIDVLNELQCVGEYFEGPADERGIDLVYQCDGAGTMWADPTLVRRALCNLLANAVRHADANSQIVLVAQRESDGTTKLAVENHGDTIPSQHLNRLFDRFYRVDAARVGSSESNGLGLSIVRSIMSLHQGHWEATSNNRLTRFTLMFPGPPA